MQLAHGVTRHRLGAHVVELVHKHLSQFAKAEHFETARESVEALHHFRVASRRLRAFVDVFGQLLDPAIGRRAKKPLRKLTKIVRSARDCDVQLSLLSKRHAHSVLDIERAALEDLIAKVTTQRSHAVRHARKKLRNVDLEALDSVLRGALHSTVSRFPPPGSPMGQWVWQLLQPFADVELSLQSSSYDLERARDMHQLRIRLKKLRYALELFEPALGNSFEQLHSPIEKLQDSLGEHHDLVVMSELIENRRCTLERQNRVTIGRAFAELNQGLAAERQVLVTECRNRAFDPDSWRHALKFQLEVERVQH